MERVRVIAMVTMDADDSLTSSSSDGCESGMIIMVTKGKQNGGIYIVAADSR
jgi:hypothetical protein